MALPPTLMPGLPMTTVAEGWADKGWVDEGCVDDVAEVLVNVEAEAGAPPERVVPRTYTTVSAMTARMTRAARRGVMMTVMWL